ncbi:hypothetical protein K435DRAFT_844952 [Dendrothele bispora CBS 962.96]|uniref:G-protein coupled receptors family 1 profile domain-containing protein n=1 Tax=Dendrothele bispora (strain CBS 962.96) TaxID=1314807 RepID=A0A4S8KY68_DENBC|nr:hypothetical protein K435DRAFT_844952 [Dendrothele bispora CBS 962.96]
MSLDNVTFPDTGELPSNYDFERTLLIGSFLGCMTWGINFTIYGAAMYFSFIRLVHQQCSSPRYQWALMAYMTVIFAMSTTYVGTNIQANVDMYINHRDDPGGPLTYALLTFNTPLVLVGNNICPVISIFLNDALLVWRLYIIWGVIWIVVIPVIMLIASTIMGILLIYTSAQPGHTFNSTDAVHFGTAYFSVSLSLTVIVTLTIVLRLVYLQHRARKVFGNTPEFQDHYISACAILLESSAMYAVIGFIFLVLYNKNNAVSNIFTQLMIQVMCISSDLIILRVMIGSAWTAHMSQEFSSLVFNSALPASITEIELVEENSSTGSQRKLYDQNEC